MAAAGSWVPSLERTALDGRLVPGQSLSPGTPWQCPRPPEFSSSCVAVPTSAPSTRTPWSSCRRSPSSVLPSSTSALLGSSHSASTTPPPSLTARAQPLHSPSRWPFPSSSLGLLLTGQQFHTRQLLPCLQQLSTSAFS